MRTNGLPMKIQIGFLNHNLSQLKFSIGMSIGNIHIHSNGFTFLPTIVTRVLMWFPFLFFLMFSVSITLSPSISDLFRSTILSILVLLSTLIPPVCLEEYYHRYLPPQDLSGYLSPRVSGSLELRSAQCSRPSLEVQSFLNGGARSG